MFEFPHYMPLQTQRYCKIVGWGQYLPPQERTTSEIIRATGLPLQEKILMRTVGVGRRRVAPQGWDDSDMLTEASRQCLTVADMRVEELSKILTTKFMGDRILPPTSTLVQKKLETTLAVQCLDVDGGTHSFLQAFDMATRSIGRGDGPVLIASGGLMHSLISAKDPRTAFLYGDGAATICLVPAEEPHLLASYHFSNPAFADHIVFMRFGDIVKTLRDGSGGREQLAELLQVGNWKDVRDYIIEAMAHTLGALLQGAELEVDQVDHFLITEWNRPLTEEILNHTGIPAEKVVGTLQDLGNTMSAALPLQFCRLQEQKEIGIGKNLVMLSIGEGITGGGIVYRT